MCTTSHIFTWFFVSRGLTEVSSRFERGKLLRILLHIFNLIEIPFSKKKQKQKQKDTQYCWSFHYFRVPQGYLINTGLGGSSFSRKVFEITRVLKLFPGKRTYTKLDCPVLLVSLILITKLFCQGGFYFTLFCSFKYEC